MGREATRVRTGVGGGNVSGGRAEKGAARGASVFDKRRRSIGGRDAPLVLVVAPHPLGRGALERDRLVGLRGHRERMRGGARAAWPAPRAFEWSRRTEPRSDCKPTTVSTRSSSSWLRPRLTGFADGLTVMAKVRSSQQPRRGRGGTAAAWSSSRNDSCPPGAAPPPRPPPTHRGTREGPSGRSTMSPTRRAASRPSPRRPPWPSTARRRRRRRGGARGRASLDPPRPALPVDLPAPARRRFGAKSDAGGDTPRGGVREGGAATGSSPADARRLDVSSDAAGRWRTS